MGQREHLARWLRHWAAAMRRHCPARPAGFRTFPPWANGSAIPLAQPNPGDAAGTAAGADVIPSIRKRPARRHSHRRAVAALGQWEYYPAQFLRYTPSSPPSSPRSRTRHSSAVVRATQPDVAAWVLARHAILRGTVIRGSGLPADVLCGIQEHSGSRLYQTSRKRGGPKCLPNLLEGCRPRTA
jgi:hypothetical protein